MTLLFARQPIFDTQNNVYGYELLYRELGQTEYNCSDGDKATATVMAGALEPMGFNQLAEDKKAFINFTENHLIQKTAALFSPQQLVIEVLESVRPLPEVIESIKALKDAGYILALDDYVFRPGYKSLVDMADFIKIDFLLTPPRERLDILKKFGNRKIKFVAEKVETREDFTMALNYGYHYFQGFYFAKPVNVFSRDIPASKFNQLLLMKTLGSENLEFEDLYEVVAKDVAFSYQILKIANSAHYYRGNEATTVAQAALRLGLSELIKWAYIMVLRKMNSEQDETVRFCAQRARTLELMSEKLGLGHKRMVFFTLGILSMLDVLTGYSMETLLRDLFVDEEVSRLLLGHLDDSSMSLCYRLVLAYEKGNWPLVTDLCARLGITESDIAQAYLDAITWMGKSNLHYSSMGY